MNSEEVRLNAIGSLVEKKRYIYSRLEATTVTLDPKHMHSLTNYLLKRYSFEFILKSIPTVFDVTPDNMYAKYSYAVRAYENTQATTMTLEEQKQGLKTMEYRKAVSAPMANMKTLLEYPLDAIFDLYLNHELTQEEFLGIGADPDKAREFLKGLPSGQIY